MGLDPGLRLVVLGATQQPLVAREDLRQVEPGVFGQDRVGLGIERWRGSGGMSPPAPVADLGRVLPEGFFLLVDLFGRYPSRRSPPRG